MSETPVAAAPPRRENRVVRWAADKAALLVFLVGAATLAACLGRLHFLLELFTHFRMFYFGAAAVLTVLLLTLKAWRWAVVGAVVVAVNAAAVLPCYWSSEPSPASANLRILQANVLTSNHQYDLLLSRVRQYRPDLIVLVEVDAAWLKGLSALSKDYPYTIQQPRRDNFGMALFSRLPIVDGRAFPLGHTDVIAISAQLKLQDRQVTLLAVHAYPPGTASMARTRDLQLRSVADIARGTQGPFVVCGDFNATPWSPVFKATLSRSGLKDARRGFGIRGTWPAEYAPFTIPLDHCLVSRGIGTKTFDELAGIGSDHLPLLVELFIPPQEDPGR